MQLNLLKFVLQRSHVLLLFEELLGHVGKGALFIFLDLFHALVDRVFPLVQLFVLVLQVDETATQPDNTHALIVVTGILVACTRDDFFEEDGVFVKAFKLFLSRVELMLLAIDILTELLDCLLVLKSRLIQFLESCILFLPLRLVLLDLFFVSCDSRKHFPLALQELLLFPIQLSRLGNDVFLLLSETLINRSLFALFLEEADSLQGTLTLHDKGSDAGQILISNLGLRVLAQVLVDAVE